MRIYIPWMATQKYRKKKIWKIDDQNVYHKDCERTYQRGPLKSLFPIKANQKAYAREESLNNQVDRMTAMDVSQLSASAIPEVGSRAHEQRAHRDRDRLQMGPT